MGGAAAGHAHFLFALALVAVKLGRRENVLQRGQARLTYVFHYAGHLAQVAAVLGAGGFHGPNAGKVDFLYFLYLLRIQAQTFLHIDGEASGALRELGFVKQRRGG
ncbi:hypothetical protein F1C16_09390 [Hymenobacter sp. NBH84]|nr:hypothetical protein F1C16_09390 [Hymenobacter sp. NBH84]